MGFSLSRQTRGRGPLTVVHPRAAVQAPPALARPSCVAVGTGGAAGTYGAHVTTTVSPRARRVASRASLTERAHRLSEAYLGGLARPASVRFVANQRLRWGSCTPDTSSIR